MLLNISDFCSSVVEKFDKSWAPIGWTVWIAWLLAPYLFLSNLSLLVPIWIALTALLLLWWFCDAMNEQVAWWQFVIGLIILALSFLPRGGLLAIGCWVLYWTKVRE